MPERPAELGHQQPRLVTIAAVGHAVDGGHDDPSCAWQIMASRTEVHPAIFSSPIDQPW
jgi:hypothetical protein